MIHLRHILVATDFEDAADVALAYGKALAERFDATLHLFHAVENVMARFAADVAIAVLPDVQADVESAARSRLDALASTVGLPPGRVRSALYTSSTPADAIVEYAKEHQIDLIVVGTHGRRALSRFLLGSVAERVVRTAPCPVLTLRHPEQEFVVPDGVPVVAGA
jgi:universal stress protein A